MIIELTISSIALIDRLKIEFSPGFNVLTGETGAGKSIVVDSMNLALGERADRDLIRAGQDKARVEAVFDIVGNTHAKTLLSEWGVDAEDGVAVIMRELSQSGRNTCRVNGTAVSLGQLKQLTSYMVDLHGQHEHQSLLDDSRHIRFLDAFGGVEITLAADHTAECYDAYKDVNKRLFDLAGDPGERQRRIMSLGQQTKEIRNAHLRPGEAAELEQKRQSARNAVRIITAIEEAYRLLGGADTDGAVSLARAAYKALGNIEDYHEPVRKLNEALEQAIYPLEDVMMELREMKDTDEFDPQAMERLEDRLSTIREFMRKYGGTEEEALNYLQWADQEYERLIAADEMIASLQKQKAVARFNLQEACEALSSLRTIYAEQFATQVTEHLADLGMKGARFEVKVDKPAKMSEAEERFSRNGFDKVSFMIAANRGEEMKPLARTASGGELSRVMLALKSVAADIEGVDTMIFDEIDTGISGRMAQVVAEKMAALARSRQIICVTHLSQIASIADAHLMVEKSVEEDRTLTSVSVLDEDGRIAELARINSGAEKPALALKHAKGMLDAARERRKELFQTVENKTE